MDAWGDYTPKDLNHARMIRDKLDELGWTDGIVWRLNAEENRDEALVGRFRIVDDVDDCSGPFAGDEGEVAVSVVGAAQHRNERVYIGFTGDGTDCPEEIRDPDLDLESC